MDRPEVSDIVSHDGVGSTIERCFEDHFVVCIAQLGPDPEGYVHRLATCGKGTHDRGDVIQAVSRRGACFCAAEDRLVLKEQSRGAQGRHVLRVNQPEKRVARTPSASKCGDDDVRVKYQPHHDYMIDIL